MDNALDIAAKTRKIDVDNRLSLRFYYRTADNLLRQAGIYREERNVIDLYILLVRFSSLVSETIPEHRDYRTTSVRDRQEYKKKLVGVLNELEGLKPEVQKQVERINQARRRIPPPTASVDDWAAFTSQFPTAPTKAVSIEQELHRELSNLRIGSVDYHESHPSAGDYWSSPSALNTVDTRPSNSSLSIPRPKVETLSRHSIYGPNVSRKQSSSASFKAQYPNYINASPIEMPSLEQSWRGPSQPHGSSNRSSVIVPSYTEPGPSQPHESSNHLSIVPSYTEPGPTQPHGSSNRSSIVPSYTEPGPTQPHLSSNRSSIVPSYTEPVLWPDTDTSPFPAGYSPIIGPDVAPVPSLVRQPDPPPVPAPVQTLESLDYSYSQSPLDHSYAHIPPNRVADPRPGSPHSSEDEYVQQKGPKHLHISTRMMDEFLALSRVNTQKNLETCAVLAGSLKKGIFYVSALIVPKQESTSDSCQTINEEEIFDVQDKRGLFQLGWIHTHPTQTCFMSSIDLHTHYSYQIMLQEAIAIVMAPTDSERKYGIFRLSDPGGIKSIQQCDQRGFHPHDEPEDGSPIYVHCSHVFMSPKLRFDVIDLRQS